MEKLTNEDERKIYQLIMEENGIIFQSQLVEKSGFSKSKVSLILDRLIKWYTLVNAESEQYQQCS